MRLTGNFSLGGHEWHLRYLCILLLAAHNHLHGKFHKSTPDVVLDLRRSGNHQAFRYTLWGEEISKY